jgi:hypothetical protein
MVKLSGGMVREADEGDDNQKSKTWGCHARVWGKIYSTDKIKTVDPPDQSHKFSKLTALPPPEAENTILNVLETPPATNGIFGLLWGSKRVSIQRRPETFLCF